MDARCGGRSLFFFVCLFVFLTACNGFFSSGTAILFLLPFAKHVFCLTIFYYLSFYQMYLERLWHLIFTDNVNDDLQS